MNQSVNSFFIDDKQIEITQKDNGRILVTITISDEHYDYVQTKANEFGLSVNQYYTQFFRELLEKEENIRYKRWRRTVVNPSRRK